MRPILMETPRVLIRPAPPYEPLPRPVDEVPGCPPDGVARPDGVEPRAVTRSRPADSVVGPVPPRRALSKATIDARRHAIRTITLVLEIVDRRRNVGQLDGLATAQLIDQVTVLVRLAPPGVVNGDTATLRRVHVQMLGPGAAEIFGSYRRGDRVRAFAARIEQLPCRVRAATASVRPVLTRAVEYRWQLVAFTLV